MSSTAWTTGLLRWRACTLRLDNLHPDIKADLEKVGNRKPVEVIDPSPGLWGGDPVPGLVTIVYECLDLTCPFRKHKTVHTHHALYGPSDENDPGCEGLTIYAD